VTGKIAVILDDDVLVRDHTVEVDVGADVGILQEDGVADNGALAYVNATEDDITIIQSPVGMPGRALKGKFIEASREGKKKPFKCVFHCIKTCDPENTPYCISSALINAMKGNLDKGFVFCGSNVGRVKSIVSVRELVESLRREYDDFMNAAKIQTA
jgi:NAD(P)H-dependent flavin oxidoreductase YrpB (nitropropane dioxygenase family)